MRTPLSLGGMLRRSGRHTRSPDTASTFSAASGDTVGGASLLYGAIAGGLAGAGGGGGDGGGGAGGGRRRSGKRLDAGGGGGGGGGKDAVATMVERRARAHERACAADANWGRACGHEEREGWVGTGGRLMEEGEEGDMGGGG